MMKVARLLLVPLSLVLLVAACGGDDDGASSEPGVITVTDNKFTPKSIEVGVGDTVTWRFEGTSAHNVTADDFHSDLTKKGEFTHTFDKAGDFSFVCTVHPGMRGTVKVSESAGGAP
jgi:plastocyanin